MTKHISTKKALLCNLLSMLLCISMLVGSTFAWFTDTASTGVNSIVAGNLDVQLVGATTDDELTAALSFRDLNGNTDILWEPGATFRTEGFRIRSNGNLSLKYTIALNGVVGDAKLLKVIHFSVVKADGTVIDLDTFEGYLGANETSTDVLYLQGTMDADAGNEYMNETLSGITLVVYATQYTGENDSNGNTYDENAKNPVRVSTAEGLKDALAAGNSVRLTSSIALESELKVSKDATIYGDGYSIISAAPVRVAGDANVTLKDVRFDAPLNGRNNASNLYCANLEGKLVVDGCSFSGTQWDCIQVIPLAGSEIVINNCRFELNSAAPSGNKTRFIHVEALVNSNSDVKITLTNNFFGASTYITDSLIDIDYVNLDGIDFGGNNIYTDTGADIYVCGADWQRTISRADAYKALGAKLVTAGTQEDLKAALDALDDTKGETKPAIKLSTGEYTLYNVSNAKTQNTTLTLEGAGADQTTFKVGKPVPDQAGEYNADYSYENSDVVFKNMTVNIGTGDYKGIVRANSLYFENCVIVGRGSYWGNGKVVFKNCTFINTGDYNICTYAGTDFTFENCTFRSDAGKFVNAYKEQKTDITKLTFKNCTFVGGKTDKPAVCIKGFVNQAWDVSFTGCTLTNCATNTTTGSNYYLFDQGIENATTVTIDGNVVWENGAKVN